MSRRPARSHRRFFPRVAAALAPLAGIAAFVAPVSAAPVTFGSGHLDWGVKQSFREYVVNIAGGSYTASDGATKLSEPYGVIRFDVLGGPYDDETGTGELLVDGTVHFTGHHGTLDMTIRNLRIALVGGTGLLHADVISNDLHTGKVTSCVDVGLGELGPVASPTETTDGGGGLSWDTIPVELTTAGAPAFDGFYSAGDAFDPLAPLVAEYGTPRPRPDRGEEEAVDNCADDGGDGDGGNGGGGAGGGGTGGGSTDGPGPGGNPAAPATVRGVAKPVTLGAGRIAKIATLRCGGANCAVTTPKSVKVKIKRKRYSVGVLAPRALKAGKSGQLRVKLSKAARKALAGRRTTVKVKVTLTADGRKTTKTIKATLKAKQAKAGATRRQDG